MALNALVDSFFATMNALVDSLLPQSEKCGTETVNSRNTKANGQTDPLMHS